MMKKVMDRISKLTLLVFKDTHPYLKSDRLILIEFIEVLKLYQNFII